MSYNLIFLQDMVEAKAPDLIISALENAIVSGDSYAFLDLFLTGNADLENLDSVYKKISILFFIN